MVAASPDLTIDLAHVSKTFKGRVHALRGVEMRVRRGEIFGLLGPNGAGKSTLVKILMTVVRATRCRGTLLGRPVGHKGMLARVGYLPEHHQFAGYLTGAQVLDFYGAMSGVPRRDRRRRTGELLDLVGMRDWANKRVGGYSKGMRQRVGLAQALINEPELVMLDEPTDGVDPVGRRDIRNILVRLRDEGKTVFLNSHLLSELELVCDRVAILVRGVVSAQGTIDELTRDMQRYDIEFTPPEGAEPEGHVLRGLGGSWRRLDTAPGAPAAAPAAYIGSLASGEPMQVQGTIIRISTTDPSKVQPVLDALRSRSVIIRSVRPIRPSLEDLFMQAVIDPATGEVMTPGADPAAMRGRAAR